MTIGSLDFLRQANSETQHPQMPGKHTMAIFETWSCPPASLTHPDVLLRKSVALIRHRPHISKQFAKLMN